MSEIFNSIVTWIQVEFSAEVFGFLMTFLFFILSAAISAAVGALRKNEQVKTYLLNIELVKELAYNLIITVGHVGALELEGYAERAANVGLEGLDPRMVYVLVQIEDALERRGVSDFDILAIYQIAQALYTKLHAEEVV